MEALQLTEKSDMKRSWILAAAMIAIVVVTLIAVVEMIPRTPVSKDHKFEITEPSAVTGKIVMHSFQTDETVSPASLQPVAVPELKPRPALRMPSSDAKAESPKAKQVGINGKSYFWLKDEFAVSAGGERSPSDDYPRGFSIVNRAPKQKTVFDFDDHSLTIVQNELGEKYVVSGSIVVVSRELTGSEIAKRADMTLIYEAGQIATYIIHAKPGQNLEKTTEKLRKNPKIASATIELLGRGARPL